MVAVSLVKWIFVLKFPDMSEDFQRVGIGRRASDVDRARMIEDIEKLDLRINSLSNQVVELRIDVGKLSVKAGVWGALAGAATAVIPLIGILIGLAKMLKP